MPNQILYMNINWKYNCNYFTVLVKGDGSCPDINGRIISPGLHYVPGPDTCTLCICENGQPKWCKAVLCSPPQVINRN